MRITWIANKMRTGHKYDFIKAPFICKSAISCTFGHLLLFDVFTPLIFMPIIFPIHNMKIKKGWGRGNIKSSVWPNVQEIADLHIQRAYVNSYLYTVLILLAIQVTLYLLRAGSRLILILTLYMIFLRPYKLKAHPGTL